MGWIKNLFKIIKSYFSEKELSDRTSKPTIEIHGRNDPHSVQRLPSSDEPPQITIGEIHRRVPDAVGTDVYRSEVDVQNPNLGHGITVRKQHMPGRCPLCATQGKVVANTNGNRRWRCEECGSTFN